MPWLARTETREERADAWPVQGLMALLDMVDGVTDGSAAPLLSQWLYFGPTMKQSQMGEDGHPARGGFLPPVDLPRRMWAASDIEFHAPIRLGAALTKTSKIADISMKTGASGALVFVKVENRYESKGTLLLEETQTLVYRDQPPKDAPAPAGKPAPKDAAWSVRHQPDEVMLFRYSAVTFNAHRIHYDQPYATAVEGYPGVIVQGQLLATLMLEACRSKATRPIRRFGFRGVQPVFAGEIVFAEGRQTQDGFDLWIRDEAGVLRTTGTVALGD
ncbi:acyl-CoA dehydrogenase [Cereibacter changlensis]|uniref:Acyl-CoA dehydrogenase n=2 Tax=Cereibacter changlensis TaxID=402884 RepID=A0A4V5NP80_9RHOB|nr:acyl-CoA dehydrogenase [Cereibacter changlensis]